MSAHRSSSAANGVRYETYAGVSLQDLPKSNVFTSNLPPDPEFKTPIQSHKSPRSDLGQYPISHRFGFALFLDCFHTGYASFCKKQSCCIRFGGKIPGNANTKRKKEKKLTFKLLVGPRMVKGALYTYVRPEKSESPELLGISKAAMRDIGLKLGEEESEDFKQMAGGNKIFWDENSGEGIYPWAQCYGGNLRPGFVVKSG